MSQPKYRSYKDNGKGTLGEVPSHWGIAPLKRLFRIVGGSTPHSDREEFWDGDIVWVTPADLSGLFNLYVSDSARRITSAGLASCGTSLVPKGSIVLSTRAPIGSLAIAATTLCTNQGCKSLVPSVEMDSLYYAYSLLASTEALNLRGKGTTFLELSGSELGAFRVASPHLAEQQSISAFLNRETAKIDALVSEQERLITLLAEKRKALISHVITKGLDSEVPTKDSGNQWIGSIPCHWKCIRLKHVRARERNAFVDGPFGSNLKSEHFVEGGDVYVIESGFATQGRLNIDELKTITKEHFATITRSETRGGDIIIAKIGAQYGKSSVLPDLDKPAVVSGNSLKLTVDRNAFEVEFINWQLTNMKALGAIEDIVNATAQPALSLGDMSNLPIVAPPLVEQLAIVSFLQVSLSALDELVNQAHSGIDLLLERRAALISAAVSGHIDVRSLAA